MIADFPSPAFFSDQPWVIPVIGMAVAGLAFLVGRMLLFRPAARPAAEPASRAEEPPMDVFLHGSTRERRSAPRRRGNSVEVYISEKPEAAHIHGWVVDRSVGGLCVLVEKSLAEGALVNIRPRSAPEGVPWTPIEVRSCRPEQGEWELGCRFVKTPQWNVLLLFG
jgi:hypothetical protein